MRYNATLNRNDMTIEELAIRVAMRHFDNPGDDGKSIAVAEYDVTQQVILTCKDLLAELSKNTEPAAFGVLEEDGQFTTWDFICGWPEAAHEHINEQIVEWKESGEEPPKYSVVKLYTTPLNAAN